MIKNINFSFLICLSLLFSGCMMANKTTLTPLEIQSIQSREYEATKDVVFASVVSVFQDLGYTIVSADLATGLITAESTTKSDGAMLFFLSGISSNKQTKTTAFIEEIRGKTRIRLNFIEIDTSSFQYGQSSRNDTPILTTKIYENAFERIESAIFIRTSNK